MKLQALLLTLIFTISPIANAIDLGKLSGSVDKEEASDSVDTDTLKSSVSITITPRDEQGNYLGPGHAGKVKVSVENGIAQGALIDNSDGSYTQVVTTDVVTSEPPVIHIGLGDETVDVIISADAGSQSYYWYVLLLLLLLIIVLLILLLLKRR